MKAAEKAENLPKLLPRPDYTKPAQERLAAQPLPTWHESKENFTKRPKDPREYRPDVLE